MENDTIKKCQFDIRKQQQQRENVVFVYRYEFFIVAF